MPSTQTLWRRARGFAAGQILLRAPRVLRSAFLGRELSWTHRDAQPVARVSPGEVRCLIAPANFGSQGYYWARAASLLPDVQCVNLQFVADGQKVVGPADFDVSDRVSRFARPWARRQLRALEDDFTHVLIEASIPLLRAYHGRGLEREVELLRARGLKVGFIAHGSDVRRPTRHMELEPLSPFRGGMGGRAATLETRSISNIRALDRLGGPEFVSTPDLLEYRPEATWLPLLTDNAKWTKFEPTRLASRVPVVLHVPSSRPALKGSEPIRESLRRLRDEGLIDYLEVNGVPYEEMPKYVARADIVVNQVGIGAYGALALESMLAGRVVVAQVWNSVRDFIRIETGYRVPIVEANSRDVYSVVKEVVLERARYSDVGSESRAYATAVHSAEAVAERLAPFLFS